MYKQLKKQIDEKIIIDRTIKELTERIGYLNEEKTNLLILAKDRVLTREENSKLKVKIIDFEDTELVVPSVAIHQNNQSIYQ